MKVPLLGMRVGILEEQDCSGPVTFHIFSLHDDHPTAANDREVDACKSPFSSSLSPRTSSMPPSPTKKPSSQSLISSTLAAIANHFKPHKAEAVQRIRLNAVCLIAALILSYLLPLPSLPTAIRRVLCSSHTFERWSSEWVYQWVCLLGECYYVFLKVLEFC